MKSIKPIKSIKDYTGSYEPLKVKDYKVKDYLATEGTIKVDRIKYTLDLEYPYFFVEEFKNNPITFDAEYSLLEYNLNNNARIRVPRTMLKNKNDNKSSIRKEIPLDSKNNEIISTYSYKQWKEQQNSIGTSGLIEQARQFLQNCTKLDNILTRKQLKYLQDYINGDEKLYSNKLIYHYRTGIQKRLLKLIFNKSTNRSSNNLNTGNIGGNNMFTEYELFILNLFRDNDDAVNEAELHFKLGLIKTDSTLQELVKNDYLYYYKNHYGITKKGIKALMSP